MITDSKVHGVKMGSTWRQQDPGRPHVGPMNLAMWDAVELEFCLYPSEIFLLSDRKVLPVVYRIKND